MAQISFSFSGGFWPISFPLFHGTTRPSSLGAVLVAAYMNGSLVVGEEPYVDPGSRALVDPEPTYAPLESVHSMTLSARSSTACGIVTPSSRAVLRLTANPTLLSDSTAKLLGLAPVRIRWTYFADKRPAS